MRKMYKDGKECMAENEQVARMKKAGWSVDADTPVEAPVDETADADTDAADTDAEEATVDSEPEETEKSKKSPVKKKPAIKRTRKKIHSED